VDVLLKMASDDEGRKDRKKKGSSQLQGIYDSIKNELHWSKWYGKGVPQWKTASAACLIVMVLGVTIGLLVARLLEAKEYKRQEGEKKRWLMAVYEKHNPDKVKDVDFIMRCYKNKLQTMITNVRKKYDLEMYPSISGLPELSDDDASAVEQQEEMGDSGGEEAGQEAHDEKEKAYEEEEEPAQEGGRESEEEGEGQ
jgi:hypothetical protein